MTRRPPASPNRGFALLITITLVAFLVLILVTLATLTRVETQVATNSQQQTQARQNALMALNLALGQLQRHAGPDQRVTATADVITPAGHTWTTLPVTSTAANYTTARNTDKSSIETNWATNSNRHWTGTWTNQIKDSDYDPDNPATSNPLPVLQAWLVSGNEASATGDTFKPTDAVSELTVDSSPLDRIGVPGNYHRLLVKAAADVAVTADLTRAVTAPEIEITATNVPGTDGSATPVGHYAWWIGDEGVKARVNLSDPYALSGTAQAQLSRLQTAQRPAIEAIDTAMVPLDPSTRSADELKDFQDSLGQVLNPDQLAYIDSSATFTTALKGKYHSLTTTSRGVLADTRHGGLKADLSYLFGRPDLTDFRTALGTVYATGFNAGDSVFAPFATPYATLPSAPAFNTTPGIFSASPTWDQLWSFANMNATSAGVGVFSTDTSGQLQASPRLPTNQQQGLYPLVIQCKLFYGLRFDPGTQEICVDGSVVLVLANPYNVKLAPTDYTLVLAGGSPRLRFGTSTDVDDYKSTSGEISINPRMLNKTEFVVRNTEGIEAGQALLFTIDAGNPGMTENRVPVSDTTATKVTLSRGFDPLTAITYNTGETLPKVITIEDAPVTTTHVGLVGGPSGLITKLYLDYSGTEDSSKLVHYAIGQFTSGTGTSGLYFIVNPISSGSRVGGGYMNVLVEPPTTSGSNTSTNRVQHAVFYQTNYRALLANHGSTDSGNPHPVEWYRTHPKNGDSVLPGNLFNPWLDADHLRSAEDPDANVRWGIVNRGASPPGSPATPSTLVPASIGGTSADDVGFENLLYDLPRPERSLASLGQLQHFNPSAYLTTTSFSPGSAVYASNIVHTWQVNYPISNSYPQPRVPRDNLYYHTSAFGHHFDGSYLWNDLLWDRFYFSTYPQETSASFDFATDTLPNARLRPFRDHSTTPWDEEENFRGDGSADTAANSRKAASNLLVDGAFNINSTSVEAWKAVLSSLRHVPIGTETPSAPFVRTLYPTGGSANASTGTDSNSFNGFRDLTPTQINDIAEEIVLQVRKRGPFLSLSEFVNRRLITGRVTTSETTADPLGLGLSGALQSAIDRVVNQKSEVTAPLNNTSSTVLSVNSFKEIDYVMPTGMSGFPGYLLQGDVLSALGSTLAARSDTFTIRTYGDSVNPATGEVIGRAWCEAIVQRTPDYVDATPATDTPAAGSEAETFGRRFQIVSFRWLSPDEI
ncbi:MAG: hypothetical protein ABII82_01420 [Verrucomicrobiota bacterium]